ncbi:YHYH protein [Psychromonas marina]|nr:YHYH protein [Psychromonas marina]
MKKTMTIMAIVVSLSACTSDDHDHGQGSNHTHETETSVKDITNLIFTSTASNCAEYANEYKSISKDINENSVYSGSLKISLEGDKCIFTTNAIPNHDFNDADKSFHNKVSEQDITYTIPQSPVVSSKVTKLGLRTDNAIFLNGVKLDVMAAGCFGIGRGFIGCGDDGQPFRYDPMSKLNSFGVDSHNAHTQPDGTYHYHGNPLAMFSENSTVASPLIGFAADGFPIYGSYFDENGTIRKAKSSYVFKDNGGPRVDITYKGKTYSPGGVYDGKYIDDFVYSASSGGDLDQCNGMTVNGKYAYYVTDTYPWVLNCFTGTPDSSFNKKRRR